jgi:hypothetical protein
MQRKESSDKSSNALKEVLKHHHWRTIFFLKIVLESHHDRPRSLSLMMGDKKAYFTICFTFEKAIVILGEAIAVDVFGKLWQFILCSDFDSNFVICRTCLLTVQILLTEYFLL